MLTRRDFCVTTAVTTATAALGSAGRLFVQPEPALQVQELRDGIWAILGGGGNSVLIRTTEGSILIDTKLPNVVDDLFDRAKGLTGAPPKMVLNTHHHGDHTGGNHAFCDGADIVAHSNVRPRMQATIDSWLRRTILGMARQADEAGRNEEALRLTEQAENLSIEQFAADHEFDQDHVMERGGTKLELKHVIPGHTDNDAFIHLPDANVIHMGDLFFHGRHPFMDLTAKSNSKGWIRCVQAALGLCDNETIVVPGHGDITDREGLKGQITYFEILQEVARAAHTAGRSREELASTQVESLADYSGNRLGVNLQNVYDEMAEE